MGKKNFNGVKAGAEVEALIEKFRPKFGNELHIQIINEYSKVLELHRLANFDEARRIMLKKITSTGKARQLEIKQKESNLLWLLKQLSPEDTAYPQDYQQPCTK